MYRYLKGLEEGTDGRTGKPVVLTGDLNVAHLDLDIHNPTAKHISKQAGLTPQERSSFGALLASGFQDALRFFYPGEREREQRHFNIVKVQRMAYLIAVMTSSRGTVHLLVGARQLSSREQGAAAGLFHVLQEPVCCAADGTLRGRREGGGGRKRGGRD
jgi:hypothetical protein